MSEDSLPARACVKGEVVASTLDQWRTAFPCWLLGHRRGNDLLLAREIAEGHIVGDSAIRPCWRCGAWLSPRDWERNRRMRRPLWTRGIQYDRSDSDVRDHSFGAGPWGTWEIMVQWRPRIRVWGRWYGHRRAVWSDEQRRFVPVREYRRLERMPG
jgi:hypothetical protein